MKKHNFNAGPSILPREVIEDTAKAVLDFENDGLSILEISHRAKNFQPVVDEAVSLFKELLDDLLSRITADTFTNGNSARKRKFPATMPIARR